jgi:extradiol dioxygenase family protein
MAVKLNHTIVHARDKRESATFFTDVFGVAKPRPFEIFGRVKARDLAYWADPAHRHKGEINTHDGGRGVNDPAGHYLEIITRPYGGG